MTLPSATQDAQRYVEAILERVMASSNSIKGANIHLTDFEDDVCYQFLKGKESHLWPLQRHRMVTQAVARELEQQRAIVTITKIKLADYFSWLAANKLNDKTENRAQFIALRCKAG